MAIKPSGDVYAWDAVEKLNVEAKNWNDLLTDEPFKRKDIITVQDPMHVGHRDIARFYYMEKGLQADASSKNGGWFCCFHPRMPANKFFFVFVWLLYRGCCDCRCCREKVGYARHQPDDEPDSQ